MPWRDRVDKAGADALVMSDGSGWSEWTLSSECMSDAMEASSAMLGDLRAAGTKVGRERKVGFTRR